MIAKQRTKKQQVRRFSAASLVLTREMTEVENGKER